MNYYLATLSYLGGAYKGFERQKKYKTIQGEVERALSSLLGDPSFIHGAGRTDAGVNAKGQTFSFASKRLIKDNASFIYAFNRLLPSDIAITSLKEVPASFDARHSCMGKVYTYAFYLGKKDPYLSFTTAYFGERKFDYQALKEALLLFVGEHNFRDFTTKAEDKDSFIRNISSITFNDDYGIKDKVSVITFKSNGFMTYQIRIMMGSVFKVALGQMSLEDIKVHLKTNSRHIISYKAPANGLTLEEVIYG
jgi:tRNA pseudouridine38-40 synthase